MKRHSNNRVAKALVAVFASTPSQRCDPGRINLWPCGLLQQNPFSRHGPSCLVRSATRWRQTQALSPRATARVRRLGRRSPERRRRGVRGSVVRGAVGQRRKKLKMRSAKYVVLYGVLAECAMYKRDPKHRPHLEHVLKKIERYHNQHRPHQGIGNNIPLGYKYPDKPAPPSSIKCESALGGLLNHYFVDKAA